MAPNKIGKALRRCARAVLGDYSIYWIYSISCDGSGESDSGDIRQFGDIHLAPLRIPEDADSASDPAVRKTFAYAGEDSFAFGAWIGDELVAALFVWVKARYQRRNRNGFWPLEPDEAKAVELVTDERFRGRGIATALYRYIPGEMKKRGYVRLFGRIWHSNPAPIRAIERAGWTRVALVVEATPFGLGQPRRFVKRIASPPAGRSSLPSLNRPQPA